MPFIDIILFALVAAFLVFRLWGVLGRRDGHEGNYPDIFNRDSESRDDNVVPFTDTDRDADIVDAEVEPEPGYEGFSPAPGRALPEDEISPLTRGLSDIQAADPGFVPSEFLSGARIAFEMTIDAFAAGNTTALKSLLGPEVLANFQRAIRDREAAGETLEETLVGINSADIVEAWLESKTAYVTVKFISEQISVTRDEHGDVVNGDPEKILELTDFWTFARSTRSRNPNWSLVETRSLD